MMHKYDLITTVAGFLKDRDEAFIVSEEQTDEERSESAAALVTMLTEYPLNWKPERGGKYESALDPVAGLYIISRDGWRNVNGPWHETMTPKAAKEGAQADCLRVRMSLEPSPRAQALEEAANSCEREAAEVAGLVDDVAHHLRKRAAILRALSQQSAKAVSFQDRVEPWLNECFGNAIAIDKLERCDRFIEEALERIQAVGYGADRAHALVDYVFGRPAGEPFQEVGGVEITLASLCLAVGIDKDKAGETELARVWTKVEKIRAKQAAKPTGSALPGPSVRNPDLVQHRLHWEGEEKPTEWREGDGSGLYPDSAFLRIEVRNLYAGGQ